MLGIWHCNIIAELPAPGYREQDQGTDRDRDRDRNMDTNTDTLCWIAKTELNVVWLWGSLGVLHNQIIIILPNYRTLNTVIMGRHGQGQGQRQEHEHEHEHGDAVLDCEH